MELPEGFDHSQQLSPCYTVVAFSFTQPVAEIRKSLFPYHPEFVREQLPLPQGWHLYQPRKGHQLLDSQGLVLRSVAASFSGRLYHTQGSSGGSLHTVVEWPCNICKSNFESAVIRAKTNKTTKLFCASWYGPGSYHYNLLFLWVSSYPTPDTSVTVCVARLA